MGTQNKNVIYTAIFDGYDILQEPTFLPEGWDFVCFTDQKIKSKNWQIRVVEPTEEDPTRNARKYKILPHRFLGSYGTSIWVDGNLQMRGNVNKLANTYLQENNMAVFDHAYARHADKKKTPNAVHSVKDQLDHLLDMADRGRAKDDPALMKQQHELYKKEGFPDDGGLLLSMALLRRHNEPDVIETMERWWEEIKRWSKRDQLSFNYAAWKTNFSFIYIQENARENTYFSYTPHSKK